MIRDIKADGVAVVQLVRNQDRKFSSVEADCFSCGYEAAKYLYKKGCTKIGLSMDQQSLPRMRNVTEDTTRQ